MPFPPPPPPPGPPTPVFGNEVAQTVYAAGDGRSLLMQSIRQGAALKKTVTNDRSLPMIGKLKFSNDFLYNRTRRYVVSVSWKLQVVTIWSVKFSAYVILHHTVFSSATFFESN